MGGHPNCVLYNILAFFGEIIVFPGFVNNALNVSELVRTVL
jgi:hypothetical protein